MAHSILKKIIACIQYDEIRTDYFNSLGIKVIRFTNNEIKHNLDSVCLLIDSEIKQRV